MPEEKNKIVYLIECLGCIGDEENEDPENKLRKKFLVYMGTLMSFGGLLWGGITAYFGLFYASLIPFGYTILTIINFTYFCKFKNFKRVRFFQILISLLLPFLFQWSLGGFINSGVVMLWSMLSVVGSMTFDDYRSNFKWLALYTIFMIISAILDKPLSENFTEVPRNTARLFSYLNLLFVSNIVFGLIIYLLSMREKTNNELEENINLEESRTRELHEKNLELENLSNKLAKYLAPQIYNSIFTGKQDVNMETKRKKLTVFFSSIQGFNDLTDELSTEDLSNLLNKYLNKMSEIALKYGGTIDKFIGDVIMIFFGDPLSNGEKEDALNCVKMAFEMKEFISENPLITNKPFLVNMGINTGYCTVGNFGSENRMDYTIVGGEVNLTSRLKSASEPMKILISSSTYSFIKDKFECEKKDLINVKGISQPIQTYEVKKAIVVKERDDSILEEGEGFKIEFNLNNTNKEETIDAIENMIFELRK